MTHSQDPWGAQVNRHQQRPGRTRSGKWAWLRPGGLLTSLATVLLLLPGCDRPAPPPAEPGTRSFDTRGVVREIAADHRKAVIRHEEIPGYMPKMTMELNVRDPKELEGISADDEITFRLHATTNTHWIDTIRRVGRVVDVPAAFSPLFVPKEVPELKPGDLVPDDAMTSESGLPITFSDFRGKAVAFTFFFTRCPLPDFCPRMNQNFQKARELLLARPEAPTNWMFLCISFDAEFDKPGVLAGYGKFYRAGNADRWLFAAAAPDALRDLAPRLDLKVAREGGSFSHNLRTVVLDPQGRIHTQFDGNTWTPEQLAEALIQAAQVAREVK